MRDYLNKREIELTAQVLVVKEEFKHYLESPYLNEEEVDCLTIAVENLEKFQESILNRTDKVYLKRIKSVVDNNDFGFYPKGLGRTPVEVVDDKVVDKLLEDSQWAMDCIGCDKKDYQNCNYYKIKASIGAKITNKDGECPFR